MCGRSDGWGTVCAAWCMNEKVGCDLCLRLTHVLDWACKLAPAVRGCRVGLCGEHMRVMHAGRCNTQFAVLSRHLLLCPGHLLPPLRPAHATSKHLLVWAGVLWGAYGW